MLGLVPVGSAPIGILSLSIRNVANRDVDTDGWNPSVGTVIADTLDEDTADNSDYAYSPNLDDRQTPLVMALNNPLEAGTYTFNFTAQKEAEWAQVKLTLLDSNLTSVGASSWTGLVDRTFNTYSVTATTTATSAYIKVEARSDASLVLDFTDPDKINPLVKNYSNSVPGRAEPMGGMYVNKYGFLTSNSTNDTYNSSRMISNGAPWQINGATGIQDVEYSPDGSSLTADKLVEDTSTGDHKVFHASLTFSVSGTGTRIYTRSVYLKPAGRQHCKVSVTAAVDYSAVFTLTGTGSVSSATNLEKSSITSLSNGWYLCSITFGLPVTTTTSYIRLGLNLQSNSTTLSYTGDGVSGVFVWGQQIQQGWNRTSYDSDPTVQDLGYSWRIAHGTEYVYKGNNLLSTPAPATRLDNIGDVQNATFSSVGTELVVSSTNGFNANFNIYFPTSIFKRGSCYELRSVRRTGPNTGSSLDFYIGRSFSSNSFINTGVTQARSTLVSFTAPDAYVNGAAANHSFVNYNSIIGELGAVQEFTAREVERLPLGLPCTQYDGNSLLWSTDLTNTSWTAVGATPIIDTALASPSGNTDAWNLQDTGGFGSHYISQNVSFTQGGTAVLSVFLQAGTIQLRVADAVGGYWCNFVSNGPDTYAGSKDATSTTSIEYIGSNWCRVSLVFVPTATGTHPVYIQVVRGMTSVKDDQFTPSVWPPRKIWGPQVDTTNTGDQFKPSLYKPTTNSISYATNVVPRVDFSTDWYTPGTPFTVYIEYGVCGRAYGGIWGAGETSGGTNSVFMVYGFGSTKLTVGLEYGTPVNMRSTNDFDYNIMNRIAVRFEPGNYAINLNGTLTTFAATNPIPTSWTKMFIGNTWTQGQGGNGHFKRLKFYPRALNDGELLNLTAGDPDQNAGVNLLTTSW